MIGESEALQRVRFVFRRYAACNAPVLIEGETGTGKELAAREIHYASQRKLGPFVPVNCGALPEALLESELFGHCRGAYTDARSSEPGLIEYARGGTLFLDEVDSLSTRAQTTLLRFLQSGEFRVVGERPLRTADVRILAATNTSLTAAAEAGRFRHDLLYRLNALHVFLPPLRDRGDDVILLARHLLDDAVERLGQRPCRWTTDALAALTRYEWPGNVRELENVTLRAYMRSDCESIGLTELTQAEPAIARSEIDSLMGESRSDARDDTAGIGTTDRVETAKSEFATAKQHVIRAFECRYLTALMHRADGNISKAAVLSGTERRQLGKMLKRYGIVSGREVT
jgi:DNA-binding NtrC family response regulator